MKKDVLIVLGSLNSPSGELSDISKSRLDYCANIYQQGNLILCTGGWGDHFNTSPTAHAFYAKQYLITKGIMEDAFLDYALSAHTVDDAVKIKPIIAKLENIKLTVITSNYHLSRVKLIFNEIIAGYSMEFVGVDSNLPLEEYENAVLHETKAIDAILKNGLYY